MNLLITGGTGFFGRALIRHLDGDGQRPFERVTILTRSPQHFKVRHPELGNLPWIDWHQGDVLEFDSLPHGTHFEYVLHAAADSSNVDNLTPLQRYRQIVQGTENLLRFSVVNQSRRFLLTSSGGVYGSQPVDMLRIPESYLGMPDPMSHHSVYGVAKRQAEHLCALYSHAHRLETIIARCFAFVGPDLPLNAHFAIGNFIRDALWAEEIVINSDGTALRSYLDQKDLANWLVCLLIDGGSGNAYNVGSDEILSISELAFLIRNLLSPNKSIRVLGGNQDILDRHRYVPDISKIKQHLKCVRKIALSESILHAAKTIISRKKNNHPSIFYNL